MKKITPQDIQKGVESVSASPESTYYITLDNLDNGDELCLAFGMGEGFDEPTVCAKIAVLAGNSAMSDYEWDFVMPYEAKSGNVWDTELSNPGDSDAEWFNTQAAQIARKLNSGKLVASACGKKKGKKKPVKSGRVTKDMWNEHLTELAIPKKDKIKYGLGEDDFFDEYSPSPETPPFELQEELEEDDDTVPFFNDVDERDNYYYSHVKSSRKPIQSMYVSEDISGNDLYTRLWSGGKDQFDGMIEDGADADDILAVVEELLFTEDGEMPTMTDVNDLIWFEPDLIRERLGIGNEPIESGCHGKSKKKGKKKAVKSGKRPIKSYYNPYNGEGSFIVSIDVVEDGEHSSPNFSNDVMDLDDFIQECKSYAESCNGYYGVSNNGDNQYLIEFKTGDDSFTDNPGSDPYYEESCGTVVVELIYPYDQEMADYIEQY